MAADSVMPSGIDCAGEHRDLTMIPALIERDAINTQCLPCIWFHTREPRARVNRLETERVILTGIRVVVVSFSITT